MLSVSRRSRTCLFGFLFLFPLLLSSGCKEEEMKKMQEHMKLEKVTVEALVKNTETLWQALGKSLEQKEKWQILASAALVALPFAFFIGVGLGSAPSASPSWSTCHTGNDRTTRRMKSNRTLPHRQESLPWRWGDNVTRQVRKTRRRAALPLPFWPWYERIPGVLVYGALKLEGWLSPRGSLRSLLRASLTLALTVAIPVFVLMPVFIATLSYLNLSTAELLGIVTNLSLSVEQAIKLLKGTVVIVGSLVILRLLVNGGMLPIVFLLAAFATGWWHGWLPF